MPGTKLHIKIVVAAGWRGTENWKEMVDLMKENWDQIQESYKSQPQSIRNEMHDHFNNQVEELGNNLFGDYANPDDLQRFCEALNDEDQIKFFEVCKENLEIETLEGGDP